MNYEPRAPYTREDAEAAFARDDPTELKRVLLDLAMFEPDWRWVQEQCIRFSRHPDIYVRGVVSICFMHIARIHGVLDVDLVFPLLEELQNDPSSWVAGNASYDLAVIKWYVFGIPNCLPFVREEEFSAELAVLDTLGWTRSILERACAPLRRSIPPDVSPERQLGLYREAFDMMRQFFALLRISDLKEPPDAPADC